MLLSKINENGIFIDVYLVKDTPLLEVEGEQVEDLSFVSIPIPNNIYTEIGISPQWTGTEWVAVGEPPIPTPQPPSDIEKLEAKIIAGNEYADFLEEIIVEMAQVIYE